MKIKHYYNSSQPHKVRFKDVVRKICAHLYAIVPVAYLLVLFHWILHKWRQYRYEVSLCLIFKNEARYLREWIEYHRMIGVEHFYLYNNFSDDNYREVLCPYVERGIVTLIEWPYKYAQVAAYEDCYRRYGSGTHWLGYIDADEFINLLQDNDIKFFLSRYNAFPSILLHWRMFGTSGVMKEGGSYLVTERYVATWPWLCTVGKSFINNDWRFKRIWLHWHTASFMGLPIYAVDVSRRFVPFLLSYAQWGCDPRAYVNHYWSRSREYSLYKSLERTDADTKGNEQARKLSGHFEKHELNNSVHDHSIQRWLILLKEQMEKVID